MKVQESAPLNRYWSENWNYNDLKFYFVLKILLNNSNSNKFQARKRRCPTPSTARRVSDKNKFAFFSAPRWVHSPAVVFFQISDLLRMGTQPTIRHVHVVARKTVDGVTAAASSVVSQMRNVTTSSLGENFQHSWRKPVMGVTLKLFRFLLKKRNLNSSYK